MHIKPDNKELSKYIDHYWIVKDVKATFPSEDCIHDFPGIKPEMIIPLKGQLVYSYLGKNGITEKVCSASHINNFFAFHPHYLKRFILIQFKPRGISSLLPFVRLSAQDLFDSSFGDADLIFGEGINRLQEHLKTLEDEQAIVAALDQWFYRCLDHKAKGFVTELFNRLGNEASIQSIKQLTNYSSSTLERYFKKETGLTAKKYQSLKRYKAAVEEFFLTQNADWLHYVDKYGYYDQSHFVKEIKRFTSHTPGQLTAMNFRPQHL